MPLALYMDQNVPRAITVGLRLRHADVLTAFEEGGTALGLVACAYRRMAG